MAIVDVTEKGCKCDRCGHEWIPHNIKNLPKVCPRCISAYWNTPKKKKKLINNNVSIGSSHRDDLKASGSTTRAPVRLPTRGRGRGSTFSTAARRDVPIKRAVARRPTQREIDRAGIGGAT